MISRRTFLRSVTGGLLAAPLAAEAQPARKTPATLFPHVRLGTARSPSPRFAAFFQGLRDLGYLNERTIAIHYLSADGRNERFPELVAECLRLKPDIIAVTTTPAAQTAKAATSTIPIVMVALGDPPGTGLVDSLARPGGNVTGMSQLTSGLAAKRLALLKEAVPRISRVLVLTFLVDPIAPLQVKALKEVAPSLGVSLLVHDIRTAEDLPAAFDAGAKERAEGAPHDGREYFPCSTCTGDRVGGPTPTPGDLPVFRLRDRRRRPDGLFHTRFGAPSARGLLRGQDPQGRQARRPARRAADEVRAGHQPQDRQGARPDDPAVAPAAGGSGDRIALTTHTCGQRS